MPEFDSSVKPKFVNKTPSFIAEIEGVSLELTNETQLITAEIEGVIPKLSNRTKAIISEINSVNPVYSIYIQVIGDALASLYLGAFDSEPANAVDGNLYFDRSDASNTKLRVYNVDKWEDACGNSAAAAIGYCPGYPYTYFDATEFRITSSGDLTALFYVGRRLQFSDGGAITYGVITSSSYQAETGLEPFLVPEDTRIVMAMEDSAVLTATINDVCFVSGVANWSPIAEDPFAGSGIADLAIGDVLGITYVVAVGDNGEVFTSSTAGGASLGLAWVKATTPFSGISISKVSFDNLTNQFVLSINLDANPLYFSIDGGRNWVGVSLDSYSAAAMVRAAKGQWAFWGDYLVNPQDNNDVESVLMSNLATGTWVLRTALDNYADSFIFGSIATGKLTGLLSDGTNLTSTITVDGAITAYDIRDTTIGVGNSPLPLTLADIITSVSQVGSSYILVTTYNGKLLRTTDGGGALEYSFISSGFGTDDILDSAYSSLYSRNIITGANGRIHESTDGGLTWSSVSNGFDPLTRVNAVVWGETAGVFIAVASNGQICRSTNGLN